ncbi:hypothetical protein BCV70DRAFT_163637 [Testicularia cyperi]|uniref:Uncharacterized protein n=1 Tax=Testicularia cyperi TaxID=1882483 RepID=A0A317XMB8_9BASI|nr:hypothetical protein BCV70DRAFT_163637 [Testicularia cyperi]
MSSPDSPTRRRLASSSSVAAGGASASHLSTPPRKTGQTTTSPPVQFPPTRAPCLRCAPLKPSQPSHRGHSSADRPASSSAPTNTRGQPASASSATSAAPSTSHHVFLRHYIGPIPVTNSHARAIAAAVAEDDALQISTSPTDQHLQQDSEQPESAKESMDVERPVSPRSHAISSCSVPSETGTGTARARIVPASVSEPEPEPEHNSSSNDTAVLPVRPQIVNRDQSSASFLSNNSYVSARSAARSVFSDTDAAQRHQTSFDVLLSSGRVSASLLSAASPASAMAFARPQSSTSDTPVGSSDQKQPRSGNLLSIRPRTVSSIRSAENLRSSTSEANAAIGRGQQHQQRRVGSEGTMSLRSHTASSPASTSVPLPLLDMPVDEVDESTPALSQGSFSPHMSINGSAETTIVHSPNGSDAHGDAKLPSFPQTNGHALVDSEDKPVSGLRKQYSSPQLASIDSSLGSKKDAAAQLFSDNRQHAHYDGLLHPTWAPPASQSPADHRGEASAGTGHTRSASQDRSELNKERARSRISQGNVGHGLPHKRSLSFISQEPPAVTSSSGKQQAGKSVSAATHLGVGHLQRSHDHNRETSRQSRMSRASTAGTFNTVGTIATDGSFGAGNDASVTQKLARRFMAGGSLRKSSVQRRARTRADSVQSRSLRARLALARNNSLAARSAFDPAAPTGPASAAATGAATPSPLRSRREASSPFAVRRIRATSHSHSQMSSSFHRFGTISRQMSIATDSSEPRTHYGFRKSKSMAPGAVGTSTGGTKWVGQSFEIGKRFWDILDARRAELQKQQPCTCGRQQAGPDAGSDVAGELDQEANKPDERASARATEVEHMKKSPDGVIKLLAQEAQDASDEKAADGNHDGANGERRQRTQSSSLDTRASADSVAVTTEANTAANASANVRTPPRRRPLVNDLSEASIFSVPQHGGAAEPLLIEARHGWSDIVSKMSSLSGGLGSTDSEAPTTTTGTTMATILASPTRSTLDRKGGAAAASALNGSADPMSNLTVPGQRTQDNNFRILARSSSLAADSDRSSSAFQSAISSLQPLSNGHALRSPQPMSKAGSASMTRQDALSHPAPPPEVEERDPHLVHALLRRKSDVGLRADGVSDVASDHAVVVKPVASPLRMTPTTEAQPVQSRRDIVLQEQDPLPLALPDLETNKDASKDASAAEAAGMTGHHHLSDLLKPALYGTSPSRRKMVKFEAGSSRPALNQRLTASLFAGKAEDALEGPSSTAAGAAGAGVGGDGILGRSGDALPRPPEEVLARPQPNVIQPMAHGADGFSPASDQPESDFTVITRKTVLKKDRMLVKLAWTPHEDLPKDLDELQARRYTIRDENWREYIVVFRMGRLELWSDPTLTSKLVGQGDRLKLRHVIPLSRGSTFVSHFSPIDRIFCVTYQPWKLSSSQLGRRGIHLRRHGTDIVLFDCRARSAAADWMWELWRELGGLIPESLEVHVPSFGLKMRIPIPEEMPLQRPSEAALIAAASRGTSAGAGLLALSSIGHSQDVGGEGFKLINRSNIIALTWRLFTSVPEWRHLVSESERTGIRFELAWRRGTELDWVVNERTVENEPRHWAVLCGSLLRDYKHPSLLELRVAAHYPTSVLVAPGQLMHEPAAIEGYLWRVKPVSGALTRIYLTTYDGHIYICRTSKAFAPDRHLATQLKETIDMRIPRTTGHGQSTAAAGGAIAVAANNANATRRSGFVRALAKFAGREKIVRRDEDLAALRQNVLEAISQPAETEEQLQMQIEAYQCFERRRQFEQIRNSDGFIDLKSIYMIKTVGQGPVRCPGMDDLRNSSKQQTGLRKLQKDALAAQREDEESDVEGEGDGGAADSDDGGDVANDIGGAEGLSLAADREEVRRARQIELTLSNGKSFRLEAFSAPVAREWVERISELVRYWRRRERADAAELMYASGVDLSELNKHLQGRHSRKTHGNITAVDDQKLSPMLGNIWNWCSIEGCRNIIRSGRLFHKKSKFGAFKARDYVLIAGRLLCFKLVRSVRTSRARQNNGIFHRRQDTVIHLRDAYVYSGKLSEDMLQTGRSDPAQAVSGIGGGGSNSGERHRIPRVYADGLFSVDEDEDCTFVIRYRPERVNTPADPTVPTTTTSATATAATTATDNIAKESATSTPGTSVPWLEDKTHKYIAMRARSKMERDLWVRCIAYEIERIVRDDVEREARLKNLGRVDFKK